MSAVAVASRGGDASGGWVLARARLGAGAEAAGWLRGEALRLAVRLDPGPRTRWAAPGTLHPARDPGPDAPTALRAWAEDRQRQARVRHLLAHGRALSFHFPDQGGAWYSLAAVPVPHPLRKAGETRMTEPTPSAPPRCQAAGNVTPYVAEMAVNVTRATGGPPRATVRCALAAHLTFEHEGIVRELDGAEGHVWGSFGAGVPVWRVRVARPCTEQAGHLPCGLYADHPGVCVPARTDAPAAP
ncbi:hypothetical protein GA0115251_135320 [Streptomyces sp. TverLS-915]|uniref:formylmethionine deformylase n=1 Tax=Streptomyces sp. TverLS-915 TaxID=1839763 RepID=UPI00081D5EED|nr:formylmethionine deformylase [Streptomyces sp. TverLS-915]SCE01519.1 hypothetical protein GA0115251_135320 [Streptomyces sp. TverLS-915]